MATRRLSLVGASELDMLNGIPAVMENMGGELCALAGEYLGGIEHTAMLGTTAGLRLLLPGDPVICDLGSRTTEATVLAALKLGRPPTLGLQFSTMPTKPWRWRLQPCGLARR